MPTKEEQIASLRAQLEDLKQRRAAISAPQEQYGILDYIMSVAEPAATIATGAIAEPIAGIGGLAKTITSGPESGTETIEQIREGLTYQPKTQAGKGGMQTLGKVLQPIVEPIGEVVQKAGDVAAEYGGPVAGAATITAIAAIPEILGLKGSKAAKKMASRKILQQSDPITMFDDAGNLKPEILESLQSSGIPESEFLELIPERLPEQAARKRRFESVGAQPTTGELTQEFGQQATEQRLLQTVDDTASEPLRQFKLRQSEALKGKLDSSFGADVSKGETGELIQQALKGEKKLLRTQKSDLYKLAAEQAKDVGDVPVFTDSLLDSVPDKRFMDELQILDDVGSKRLNEWLTRFGVKEATEDMINKGFEPEVLTLENFDTFRKGLNQIGKGSDSAKAAIIPIVKALDTEVDALADTLRARGLPEKVIEPLKQARATVRKLRTEFDPKGLVDRLITKKGQGEDMLVEATQVYDKLTARSVPVEQVNRVVNSLKKAEGGEEAISSLQASIVMDLIDAGFGTESRKISGVRVFNPIAFKKRLKNIGQDKVSKIFENNRDSFRTIRNIEKVSSDLIPAAGAVPKGSASVILDLMNKLGLATISTKIPGGAFIVGAVDKISQPIKTGMDVKRAMSADIDVGRLESLVKLHYPGLTAALVCLNR